MDRHPCPHRTSNETLARCKLAAEVIGAPELCGVHRNVCSGCLKHGAPELTAPNPYLSMVLFHGARTRAKAAGASEDLDAWLHWSGLMHLFRARLPRLGRKPTPESGKPTEPRQTLCEHLGKAIARKSCNCPRQHTYECQRFKDSLGELPLLVVPATQCTGCAGYAPDPDAEAEEPAATPAT